MTSGRGAKDCKALDEFGQLRCATNSSQELDETSLLGVDFVRSIEQLREMCVERFTRVREASNIRLAEAPSLHDVQDKLSWKLDEKGQGHRYAGRLRRHDGVVHCCDCRLSMKVVRGVLGRVE
jgi:hypothetical protein